MARREINHVEDFLFETFNLSSDDYRLFFHSGATEGMNTLILGASETDQSFTFFYSALDHSCVVNLVPKLEQRGHQCIQLPHNLNGDLDIDQCEEVIKKDEGRKIIQCTFVNNENRIVSPL